MNECLAIVADDLTGAIDTAGVFASANLAAHVSLFTSTRPLHSDFDVLCIDTDTRYVPATEAARRVREETETLLSAGRSPLYKKTTRPFAAT